MSLFDMFGQLKDVWELQKQAKAMQKQMREIKVVGEAMGGKVKVHMNGLHEVEHITLESELEGTALDKIAKEIEQALKDAHKKIEKAMASSMDMNQIKGMLGR